jgi:hypothetical protein
VAMGVSEHKGFLNVKPPYFGGGKLFTPCMKIDDLNVI